ncbi:hypothetical protein CB1_001907050 [Camelus ferus]|nr:hypothetical protein CB1_001907050 [Camelus ferus]
MAPRSTRPKSRKLLLRPFTDLVAPGKSCTVASPVTRCGGCLPHDAGTGELRSSRSAGPARAGALFSRCCRRERGGGEADSRRSSEAFHRGSLLRSRMGWKGLCSDNPESLHSPPRSGFRQFQELGQVRPSDCSLLCKKHSKQSLGLSGTMSLGSPTCLPAEEEDQGRIVERDQGSSRRTPTVCLQDQSLEESLGDSAGHVSFWLQRSVAAVHTYTYSLLPYRRYEPWSSAPCAPQRGAVICKPVFLVFVSMRNAGRH